MGPRTADFEAAFEAAFAGMTGTRHAVMVSSGTAALHLAFSALGLGPADEVIVPSLSFVATANAVAYTGATPRFADIAALERPLMDPESVRALIGPRTAAICAVHYAGYVGFMAELRDLADRNGLALVEDAAHAPGAGSPEGLAGPSATSAASRSSPTGTWSPARAGWSPPTTTPWPRRCACCAPTA